MPDRDATDALPYSPLIHVEFNPNPTYSNLTMTCAYYAADGYALLRVVPVDTWRSIAVFQRIAEDDR